jgi:hypothetical protein
VAGSTVSTGGGAVPRRRQRRADHATVFAHGRQRRVVVEQDTIPEAESADLLVGRITSLVDRLRLQRRK